MVVLFASLLSTQSAWTMLLDVTLLLIIITLDKLTVGPTKLTVWRHQAERHLALVWFFLPQIFHTELADTFAECACRKLPVRPAKEWASLMSQPDSSSPGMSAFVANIFIKVLTGSRSWTPKEETSKPMAIGLSMVIPILQRCSTILTILSNEHRHIVTDWTVTHVNQLTHLERRYAITLELYLLSSFDTNSFDFPIADRTTWRAWPLNTLRMIFEACPWLSSDASSHPRWRPSVLWLRYWSYADLSKRVVRPVIELPDAELVEIIHHNRSAQFTAICSK